MKCHNIFCWIGAVLLLICKGANKDKTNMLHWFSCRNTWWHFGTTCHSQFPSRGWWTMNLTWVKLENGKWSQPLFEHLPSCRMFWGHMGVHGRSQVPPNHYSKVPWRKGCSSLSSNWSSSIASWDFPFPKRGRDQENQEQLSRWTSLKGW